MTDQATTKRPSVATAMLGLRLTFGADRLVGEHGRAQGRAAPVEPTRVDIERAGGLVGPDDDQVALGVGGGVGAVVRRAAQRELRAGRDGGEEGAKFQTFEAWAR